MNYTFTSESVSEGHPDKVCDFIADSILDAYLEQDPKSRVACEVLCKEDTAVIAGEITSEGTVNHDQIVRDAIRYVGYTDERESFNADAVKILELITKQSAEISRALTKAKVLTANKGRATKELCLAMRRMKRRS